MEDAEFAKSAALKSRGMMELELQDAHSQIEDLQRSRSDIDTKLTLTQREKYEIQNQLEENEEELAEVRHYYYYKLTRGGMYRSLKNRETFYKILTGDIRTLLTQ